MMGTTSSITVQSLGRIVQRAPAVVATRYKSIVPSRTMHTGRILSRAFAVIREYNYLPSLQCKWKVYELFRTTMRPNTYVLEYFHHKLATLVDGPADGSAMCFVRCKAHLVKKDLGKFTSYMIFGAHKLVHNEPFLDYRYQI